MSSVRHIQNSFNGGELSERMTGRTDTAVYQIGLETCENFVPTVEGPIVKRPGLIYVCDADPSASWLGGFRFSLTQHYVLEWGQQKLRFFTNDARIETAPGMPYEVATPYAAADAPAISCEQSHDRLYLAHPSYRSPAALKRTGAVVFSHEYLTLRDGPWADQNINEGVTVSASDVAGVVTLTASAPIFAAGHVGSLFALEAKDFSSVQAWEAGMKDVIAGTKVRSDGKVYQAITGGTTGSIQPIHEEGVAWDGMNRKDLLNEKGPFGIRWEYVSDKYGHGEITAVGAGGLTATLNVRRRLPDSLTVAPSWRWSHSAISQEAGWPGLVKIWKGRMVLVKDLDLIASVANDYGGGQVNFRARTSSGLTPADLSFRRALDTPDLPHWIAGDRALLMGTPSLVIAVKKVNAQAALAGDNIEAEPQIFKGTAPVPPIQIGGATLFAQRGGRKIREAGYDFSADRYLARNLNVWSRHVIAPGAIQFAYQDEPEELLFAVRRDGQMAVHPYSPEQEIKGFARIVPGGGGKILSAVAIAAPDGLTDQIWVLVERCGVKRICRMAPWRDDGDDVKHAFFVDEGVTLSAAAGQHEFGGVMHLAGQTVSVLANGSPIEDVPVDGAGNFSIPEEAAPAYPYVLTVGLPYVATATLLRPELKPNGETMQGARQRVIRMVLRLLDTIGLRVGAKGGKLDNLIDRSTGDAMGEPSVLFTGDSQKAVSGDWGVTGQTTMVSTAPLPATIICAMPQLGVDAGQ